MIDKLLYSIRIRKLYNDSSKLLSQLTSTKTAQGLSNNAKFQLKKNLKKQLKEFEMLPTFEADLHLVNDLCSKLRHAV